MIDEDSLERYGNEKSEFGKRLRNSIDWEEECFYQNNRRCAFLNDENLCDLYKELGPDSLCDTCRLYPRHTEEYEGLRELSLSLSCPEAARLILTAPPTPFRCRTAPGGEAPDYDPQAMEILRSTRQTALDLLAQSFLPPYHALAVLLLYGYAVQDQLDGAEETQFSPENALKTARSIARHGDLQEILDFYADLEILTPGWKVRLEAPAPSASHSPLLRPLARYFVERYWLQAVSDYDLVGRVKLVIASCLVIDGLGGDFLATAQTYSKEIENDADNIDALLDAAYHCPAFADTKLLGLLLQ